MAPIIDAATIAAFFFHDKKLKGAPDINTYHVSEIEEKHDKIHFNFTDDILNV